MVALFVFLGFRSSSGMDFLVSGKLKDHLVKLKSPSQRKFFRSFENEVQKCESRVAARWYLHLH